MAAGKEVLLTLGAENRWWLSDPMWGRGHKPVLLERTNHLGPEAALGRGSQETVCAELALSATPNNHRGEKSFTQEVSGKQGQSTFTEVPQLKKRQARERGHSGLQQLTQDVPRGPADGTVFVGPSGASGEQRSAFSKPAKCSAGRPGSISVFQQGRSSVTPGELLGLINMAHIPCWGQLSDSKLLVGDIWNLETLPQNAPLCTTFLGASTLWFKHTMVQVPIPLSSSPTISWTLLPPTLTFLGLSTQNWCAKCNLSFRLTSDLVFHIRSHHKKEHVGPDLHSKKPREEALTCPMCHEYFWERHHLSRHMTSHS